MKQPEEGGRSAVSGTRCLIDIDARGAYGWRLIAQNGRVVAVSACTYEEHGACRDAFEVLCTRHADMVGGVQHAPEGNGWMWLLRDAEGTPTAVSGRAYERHSTCRSAYERFRALLGEEGEVLLSATAS
ncbi:hypothetical protein ACIQMR_24990 [Streptomyces sp. NPDC091376]|uniref:hypothetical protein n=1 Tax=Streptomyces sp. NPDC091376 TaxID=3365994 RepID=UPI00380C0888